MEHNAASMQALRALTAVLFPPAQHPAIPPRNPDQIKSNCHIQNALVLDFISDLSFLNTY